MSDRAVNSKREHIPVLILIDGHSLAFRAYHAFAHSKNGRLETHSGIPTSVCFGFLNTLIQVVESEKPEYIAIAFDRREPSFRQEKDAQYKANRKETPEDLICDLENLQKLLTGLNLPTFTAIGYEADDILATLADKCSQQGYQVKILTGDRDLFQMVDDEKRISVLFLGKNAIKSATSAPGYTEFNALSVLEKMGVKPSQVVDYKALCGDASDNIPGVSGIGDKRAVQLLQQYGSLESIYQHLDEIKGVIKTKLKDGEQSAKHSQFLAQLVLDVPLEFEAKKFQFTGFNLKAVQPLLEQLELNKIIQRLKKNNQLTTETKETNKTHQLSLFDEDKIQPKEKTPHQVPIKPQIIDTPEKLDWLVDLLKTKTNPEQPVAWDTETTSLEPRDAQLVGIGCCWGDNFTDVAYIPLNHSQGKQLRQTYVLNVLRPLLESDAHPKAFQNTKFDRLVLKYQGIILDGVVFDTLLASYVIDPESSHKLSSLSTRYLSGMTTQEYDDLGIPKNKTIADLEIETIADYCGMDVYATFSLVSKLRAELTQCPDLYKLLLEVEQPLEKVLSEMESVGIKLDIEYLKKLSTKLDKELQEIEKKAYEAAGETFNLSSPKQLSELLFNKLGLSKKKTRKTKTAYSTDHATLEKLQGDHPVIDYILESRTLAKLKSTYVDALPALVRADTQRIHTDFNQAVTATGRLSSSNPNLQNIPIRTEFSRQIRRAFIPDKDWILVSADYSQIELRILTHLSQEPVLLEAYNKGDDVHKVTARLLFDKQDITPEERIVGKTINFGVIYGMGAQRFARESGLSIEEGRAFIDKYQRRYPRIFDYLETVKKQAITNGYVTTIKGRRRYFEFGDEKLRRLRGLPIEKIDLEGLNINYGDAQLLRAAANAPIQGSSADIIKIAMVKIHEILQPYQGRLLLQVHDELIFEMPPNEWEELRDKIKSTMENAVSLSVPLVVEIHAGKNWMEAK